MVLDRKIGLTRRLFLGSSVSATMLAAPSLVSSQERVPLVRIRLRSEPFPFDPAERYFIDNEFIYRSIYAPISRLTGSGWTPYLASEIAEDHQENGSQPSWGIRITLPEWSSWSGPNSRAVTPNDVAQSILRLKQSGLSIWQDVKSAETPDARTVRLTLKKKNVALWRDAFPRAVGCITYEGAEVDEKNTDQGEASGPYQIEAHEWNLHFLLKRREEWQGHPVKVERAQFLIIPQTEVALAAFRAGEIDIVDVTSEMLGSQRQRNFEEFEDSFVEVRDTDRVYYVGMDVNEGETADQNVREAVEAVLDTNAIMQAGFGVDGATNASGLVPRQYVGALLEPISDSGQNLDLAKEKLAASPYSGGFSTTLWVPSWLSGPGPRMAEVVRSQLQQIGITAEIRSKIPLGAWFDGQRRPSGIYLQRTPGAYDPAGSLESFRSESQFNSGGFKNPEFDEMFGKALFESDEDRTETYQSMQKILLGEKAVVPIAQSRTFWLVRQNLVVPSFSPNGQLGDLIDFERAG